MATHFSANQYEDAFSPKHLQNYQVPAQHKDRPSPRQGTTKIIANDRGHLNKGIPRDSSSPWGSFVGTWQAEIRPPTLMTRTKLVNPRTIIKSPPPRTAVAEDLKPANAQEEKKPSSPATSKVEEAAADKSRSGSPAKSMSTKPPSPATSKVEEAATDKSRTGSPAKSLSLKSTKPPSPSPSKVEEATVMSNKSGSPTTKTTKTKSMATTPVSVRNDNIAPTDQQPVATTPVKPSTPQATVTDNNTTLITDNRPPSKNVVTPDASTKPTTAASVASPPKDAVVTTPQ